ncbi:kif3 [Symbiodinium sp. KB8]|nr:kif3 [Symbiodinium sp. KB8]
MGYVEIYCERVRDLLCPEKDNLRIREEKGKGIWLEDVTEAYAASPSELYDLLAEGNANRAVGATKMNADSSRSHSVVILSLTKKDLTTEETRKSQLFLVDLAGSEMVNKTGASGQTLQEAKMINKSLSALGNVIRALTEGKPHVPYRDSKLTRLLQDSLGGNAKTSLIITCSPSTFNAVETLSTIRFGQRAKAIKNKPSINAERSVAEYQRVGSAWKHDGFLLHA